MDKRLLLASPHMSDEGYELEYIHDAFQKNWIAPLGENVNEFEKAMGEFMGEGYPVALSAGTGIGNTAVQNNRPGIFFLPHQFLIPFHRGCLDQVGGEGARRMAGLFAVYQGHVSPSLVLDGCRRCCCFKALCRSDAALDFCDIHNAVLLFIR